MAAGVFVLKTARVGEKFIRRLWIKKMRGTATDPAEYEFSIVKGKGVVLMAEALQPLAEGLKPFQVSEFSNGKVEEPINDTLQPFDPEKIAPEK